MAGIKRKSEPDSKSQIPDISKKPKKEHASPPVTPDLEAETDSDPIVESDTASQSGDDDGESWPSDDSAENEDSAGPKATNGASPSDKVVTTSKLNPSMQPIAIPTIFPS